MRADRRVNPFSLSALRFHVPLVVGVVGCVWAGLFELSRAKHGHTVAWVYAFEWPGFAVAGIYMWWRIITNHDEPRSPRPPRAGGPDHDIAPDDPGLTAWQRYLADANSRDRMDGVDSVE
jgi:hypothetical protein